MPRELYRLRLLRGSQLKVLPSGCSPRAAFGEILDIYGLPADTGSYGRAFELKEVPLHKALKVPSAGKPATAQAYNFAWLRHEGLSGLVDRIRQAFRDSAKNGRALLVGAGDAGGVAGVPR